MFWLFGTNEYVMPINSFEFLLRSARMLLFTEVPNVAALKVFTNKLAHTVLSDPLSAAVIYCQ